MAIDRLKGAAELMEQFADMTKELVRQGLARPIRYVALGCNGAVLAARMGACPARPLVEGHEVQHIPREGIWLTLNFMWLDATGRTAIRAVIDPTGIAYH